MDLLSNDLLELMCLFLSPVDLSRLTCVNKRFKYICDKPFIWKPHLLKLKRNFKLLTEMINSNDTLKNRTYKSNYILFRQLFIIRKVVIDQKSIIYTPLNFYNSTNFNLTNVRCPIPKALVAMENLQWL